MWPINKLVDEVFQLFLNICKAHVRHWDHGGYSMAIGSIE